MQATSGARKRLRPSVSLPAIKAVLFDKDGTLLDFQRTWGPINRRAALLAAAGNEALAGHLMAVGGFDPATGLTAPDSLLASAHTVEIAEAWVEAGSPLSLDHLARALDDLFTRSATGAVPVTDLAAFFRRLRARGLRTGIASSDSEASIRATAVHFGFADTIDFIAGYDSGHGVKPGGGMVDGFCATVGVPAAATAVVGDNLHDLAMARAGGAGLAVGVLTGTGTRETLEPVADICLAGIDHLEAVLFPT